MSDERLTARITGRVQGVGYRWWTARQARALGLLGWVMNDDSERAVEVVAEGTPAALDELERRLRRGPQGAYVERFDCRRSVASGEFSDFGIVRR